MRATSWPDLDELLGEVVADLAATDDEYEHGSGLLGGCGAALVAGWPVATAGPPAVPRPRRDRACMAAAGMRAPVGASMPGRPDGGRPR